MSVRRCRWPTACRRLSNPRQQRHARRMGSRKQREVRVAASRTALGCAAPPRAAPRLLLAACERKAAMTASSRPRVHRSRCLCNDASHRVLMPFRRACPMHGCAHRTACLWCALRCSCVFLAAPGTPVTCAAGRHFCVGGHRRKDFMDLRRCPSTWIGTAHIRCRFLGKRCLRVWTTKH